MPISPDQVPERWGDIASAYEQSFQGLSTQFAADAVRLLDIQPGERVLDVAAGTGAFATLAARAGAEVLATDFSAGMIERLRESIRLDGVEHVTAEVMDGQSLTVPDGSFDAAASVLGLIFFPDIAKGLSELHRALRPGGRAAVVCWDDPKSLPLMTSVMQAIRTVVPGFRPPPGPPVWARLAGATAVREQMTTAGFTDVEVTTSTRSLTITSPESFWDDFNRSAPPLAYLFQQLGPDRTAAAGRVFMASLTDAAGGGTPSLSATVCIGVGRRA